MYRIIRELNKNADKRIVINCDMDGVLADFDAEPNAVERFRNEQDFFTNLKPILSNVIALKLLKELYNADIYIISASPNARCDADKRKWLKMYAPFIEADNIITMRIGENKADYVKARGILFDDFGKNIEQWKSADMPAIKVDADDTIMKFVLKLDRE